MQSFDRQDAANVFGFVFSKQKKKLIIYRAAVTVQ